MAFPMKIFESSNEAFDLVTHKSQLLWNKFESGNVDRQEILSEISELEKEVKLLKKLEDPETLDEKRKYVAIELSLKMLKDAYFRLNESLFRFNKVDPPKSSCAPIALQRVTNASDEEIENVCTKHRWSEHYGMNIGQIVGALKSLGHDYKSRYDLVFYRVEKDGRRFNKRRTLNQLLKIIPNGKFLVGVRGHTIAVIDGKIYDDAQFGLKHLVNDIIEIT